MEGAMARKAAAAYADQFGMAFALRAVRSRHESSLGVYMPSGEKKREGASERSEVSKKPAFKKATGKK